jgi:hypothetical protein
LNQFVVAMDKPIIEATRISNGKSSISISSVAIPIAFENVWTSAEYYTII